MKINGTFKSNIVDQKNHAHINFVITNYGQVMTLGELEEDVVYTLDIKKVKSQRSLNQNRLMWALLHKLEEASKQDIMIWYCHILEETNCKFTHLMGEEVVQKELLDAFRAVRNLGKREVNGKEVIVYRCYYGSSKYTVAEMNDLLEVVLRYCAEYNIPTEMYDYE